MHDFKDRLKAAIIGLCTADALGVPVEFKSRPYLRENPVTDMIGQGTHNQLPGTWSDDSSMTFCTMESLCQGYNPKRIADNFVKWRYESFWTPYGIVFDIGISTSKAIINYKNTNNLNKVGNDDERSNGNGSLMRILPLAFYFKNEPIEKRFEYIREVSSITHGHIRSTIACFIYIEFAILLIDGTDKFTAYVQTIKNVNAYLKKIKVSPLEFRQFNKVLSGTIQAEEENNIRSSGYVLDSLEAAFWILLTTGSYEEAVLKAVNLGSDTDTTAAITGGIAGILYGFDSIPTKWSNKLARINDIFELIEKFSSSLKH